MKISEDAFVLMNMAFDISGIIILLLITYSLLRRPFEGKKKNWFLVSVILHVIALFMIVAGSLVTLLSGTSGTLSYVIMALFFDVVSIGIIMVIILSDSEGEIHFAHRTEPLSMSLVLFLIIPNILAFVVEIMVSRVRPLGIAYAVSLYLIYGYLREKYEKRLSDKERVVNVALARLHAQQMQPHFIFNSLMAIETLVRTDPDKAEESIENLSGYLRGNIDALMSDKWIPFTTELSHIREYVELELADPDRQFEIEYDLEVQDFTIPALTVQPIVENAVKHGALSRKDKMGKVILSTKRQGSFIKITIEDNGNATQTETPLREHEGVGMKNAETRIITECGGSFHFEKGEDGARTVILIPRETSRNDD